MIFELLEDTFEDSATPLVVVIDDEFTSRIILERVANSIQKDILVKTFGDPTTAISWIRDNHPDLVLVDYMMAGMTGLEAVKQMRQIASLEGVPIVMVTSTEDKEIRYQALDAGASDFITKPIDPAELFEQPTTADRPSRHSDANHGRPQPDCLGARDRVGENVGDQTQCGREDHGGADTHRGTRGDQRVGRTRLCRNSGSDCE